jgi:hypothetical protein
MAVLVRTIIERVAKTLIDDSMVGWTEAELYDYYNAAQAAVSNAKPDAYTKQELVPLVAGVVQETPADCVSLLNIYYNQSGAIINLVGLDLLNQANPNWPARTPDVDVEEFVIDQRNPRRYLVNPPNDGTGSVMMLYGADPPVAVPGSPSTVAALPDIYQNALWAFTLSLAYAKNSKRQDLVKANNYMQLFNQFVGIRAVAQVAQSPKLDNTEPL